MPVHLPARRRLLAASAAALLPMQRTLAYTRSAGGDWLDMVKAHHALIARSLEDLVQGGDAPEPVRQRLARTLAYQLSAHALAEENAIDPELTRHGLAAAGVSPPREPAPPRPANPFSGARDEDPLWAARVRQFEAAVQHHARQGEAGGAYPKLQQKLDARQNAALAEAYQREFASVRGRS